MTSGAIVRHLRSAAALRTLPPAFVVAALGVAGCRESAPPPAAARPVRTVTVAPRVVEEPVSLTGQIQPRDETSLSFRIGGRMVARPVDVGSLVRPGAVVARLDPRPEEDGVRSAEAALAAARAQFVQARNTFERQNSLLEHGFTTRAQFDQAQQQLQSAQSQVDAQEAQLRTAQDRLGYSDLKVDAAGIVTSTGAESGEVVGAGQTVVKVARLDGRDAVFEVPAALIRSAPRDVAVTIALTDDPTVRTTGQVREIAPQADPVTRTYRVKVALADPPPAMRLGATVAGSVRLVSAAAIVVPASALTQADGRPALWIVDAKEKRVSLRTVEVARYDQASVVLAGGVEPGEIVVTAGVQALRPGQTVRLTVEPS